MDDKGLFRNQMQLVADAIDKLCIQLRNWDEDGLREPETDSIAAKELAEELEWADSRFPHPVSGAHAHAEWYWFAAVDHLQSAAAILRAPAQYGTQVMAGRVCLEASGFAAWLAEPSVGIKERLRRGLIDRVWSEHEMSKQLMDRSTVAKLSSLGASVEERSQAAVGQTQAFVDWGNDNGLIHKRKISHVADLRPNAVTCLEDHCQGTPLGILAPGNYWYRGYSGLVHSNPAYLALFTDPAVILGEEGQHFVRRRVTGRQLVEPIFAATQSMMGAHQLRADLRGWRDINHQFLKVGKKLMVHVGPPGGQ